MSRLHTGILQRKKRGRGAWHINVEISSLHSAENLGALEYNFSPSFRLSCKTDISIILYNVSAILFFKTTVPVECTWTGFVDTESPIKEYRIMMGNAKGDDSIYSGGSVPGHIQRFSIQGRY